VIKKELAGVSGEQLERRVATALAPALSHSADVTVRQDDTQPIAEWRRVQIADGIELHVRTDALGARDEAVVAMREAIRAALGRTEARN
jgi:hypothetical protein